MRRFRRPATARRSRRSYQRINATLSDIGSRAEPTIAEAGHRRSSVYEGAGAVLDDDVNGELVDGSGVVAPGDPVPGVLRACEVGTFGHEVHRSSEMTPVNRVDEVDGSNDDVPCPIAAR